jgi:hypothetical protein
MQLLCFSLDLSDGHFSSGRGFILDFEEGKAFASHLLIFVKEKLVIIAVFQIIFGVRQ